MTQAKKAIRAIAKKLGLNQVDLKNSRIEFPFRFSNANAGVSAQHQSEYGGSYQDLAKALTCLPTIVENAELIETHTEKKRGTKKENPDLKQVYVLLGAMKDGESIIPIQMEVKEFKNANGGLYMTVAMTKIKESDVVKKLQAGESAAATSLLSDSSISIQDILRNVKAEDGRFLKYAPDAFLNDEQKAAKRRAIQRQTEEYASYKVDGNGKASVEVSGINNRTAAELRREYKRRMQEYQKATQRDDQSFPYIAEMKWIQAAERRLAELGDGKHRSRTVGSTKRKRTYEPIQTVGEYTERLVRMESALETADTAVMEEGKTRYEARITEEDGYVYAYCGQRKTRFMSIHSSAPQSVGRAAASAVHVQLPVSFFTDSSVVEHGQCISVNTMTHAAVFSVQPFASSIPLIAEAESVRFSVPSAI